MSWKGAIGLARRHNANYLVTSELKCSGSPNSRLYLTVNNLQKADRKAKFINFPNRSTPCGQLIDSYLRNAKQFSDQEIHLLFTLNRWEARSDMEKLLAEGITLIVDRYSYSGVAFSAAKGLDLDWCKAPEAGLLKPDLVLFLTLTEEAAKARSGYGEER